ncbi:hypothetical protein FIS3754_49990 [Fischerella sp. NIES-3754]|nr:hypothetical protein FIS3754_49990 [Fischerella sp. NIES-3754]BCX06526.1 MAG: hypothetical protein KatS3mg066_0385 [Fischerella sp.]
MNRKGRKERKGKRLSEGFCVSPHQKINIVQTAFFQKNKYLLTSTLFTLKF